MKCGMNVEQTEPFDNESLTNILLITFQPAILFYNIVFNIIEPSTVFFITELWFFILLLFFCTVRYDLWYDILQ